MGKSAYISNAHNTCYLLFELFNALAGERTMYRTVVILIANASIQV